MKRGSKQEIDQELANLRLVVQEQQNRIEALTPALPVKDGDRPDRRHVLKMAGAAVAGAAGAIALRSIPADAASTYLAFDQTSFGAAASNQSNATTQWFGSSTYATGASLLIMDAFTYTPAAINAGGLQVFTKGAGTGGYFVSQTGYDLWVNGTGRVAQVGRGDVGSTAPNWTPGTAPITNSLGSIVGTSYFEELVRGNDSSLWASRTTGALKAAWKRMNTVRVDAADGSGGVFVPVRIIDTRNSTGGVAGPLAANSTTSFGPFTGTNGLPTDAVGIIGNLTVAGYSGAGYVTIFPAGSPQPVVSSLDFAPGVPALANGFTVGFGTGLNAGKISIFVSNNVPTHVVVDLFAYIQ
jgi:hypothetical protein